MSAATALSEKLPKAVLTTLQRAETLLIDGYTIVASEHTGVFLVTTPERYVTKQQRFETITYTVDFHAGTCNCQQFASHNVCKHGVAVRKYVEKKRDYMRYLLGEMKEVFEELGELAQIDAPLPETGSKPLAREVRRISDLPNVEYRQASGGYGELPAPTVKSKTTCTAGGYGTDEWRQNVANDFD